MTDISVVIPCYRSAQTLPTLVERLLAVLSTAASQSEVVLVVDGSVDDTWEVAQELVERRDAVRAVLLARNYGQHNAPVAGIRCASYGIVTMGDDLIAFSWATTKIGTVRVGMQACSPRPR
ncbi:glycosyltransferase [Microbispora sp. GKU 823]|uniref:glycosyltransferase n=1 Tax=Microbispora sp. GKU 823 TaxID=1652100 RepID=UPI0009A33A62|nr:glycosyltransferase [Microbispora sp. GKU 823]OPG12449.1 hypothetical protein B1L11_14670 [Microbispora sp. GKU 823]